MPAFSGQCGESGWVHSALAPFPVVTTKKGGGVAVREASGRTREPLPALLHCVYSIPLPKSFLLLPRTLPVLRPPPQAPLSAQGL